MTDLLSAPIAGAFFGYFVLGPCALLLLLGVVRLASTAACRTGYELRRVDRPDRPLSSIVAGRPPALTGARITLPGGWVTLPGGEISETMVKAAREDLARE